MPKNSECVFRATIGKGYLIKSLVDVVQEALQDSHSPIIFSPDGVYLTSSNSDSSILVSLNLNSASEYHCPKEMYISFDLKHLRERLKSIKKKTSLEIFILKEDVSKWINFRVSQTATDGQVLTETIKITYTPCDDDKRKKKMKGICNGYCAPINVKSTFFQNVRKLSSKYGIYLTITIQAQQPDKFIKLESDDEMYASDISVGDFIKGGITYSKQFPCAKIQQLIKLCTLSGEISFYAPEQHDTGNTERPLCISTNVGDYGQIYIYIKSSDMYEQ